jgi:hypothetical protein
MKNFNEFQQTYLFATRTVDRSRHQSHHEHREHQISQAKLAIATANRKLENLESSRIVFQSFAEYELEPPDVGELREEVAARRSDWGQPINFLNLQPLNARSGLLSSKSKNSLKA